MQQSVAYAMYSPLRGGLHTLVPRPTTSGGGDGSPVVVTAAAAAAEAAAEAAAAAALAVESGDMGSTAPGGASASASTLQAASSSTSGSEEGSEEASSRKPGRVPQGVHTAEGVGTAAQRLPLDSTGQVHTTAGSQPTRAGEQPAEQRAGSAATSAAADWSRRRREMADVPSPPQQLQPPAAPAAAVAPEAVGPLTARSPSRQRLDAREAEGQPQPGSPPHTTSWLGQSLSRDDSPLSMGLGSPVRYLPPHPPLRCCGICLQPPPPPPPPWGGTPGPALP